jgi:hypothetical protein
VGVIVRSVASHVAPALPGLAAWPAGVPWPGVFTLAALGTGISAGLTWMRLRYHQVEEAHRHDEIMTVLAHPAVAPDATAIIAVLRAQASASALAMNVSRVRLPR